MLLFSFLHPGHFDFGVINKFFVCLQWERERERESAAEWEQNTVEFAEWPVRVIMIEIDSIWIFVMHSLLFPRHACALIMITSGIIGFPFHYSISFFHSFSFRCFRRFAFNFRFFRCWTNSFARHAESLYVCEYQSNVCFSRCHENHFYGFQISFLQHIFSSRKQQNFTK